jgi:carbonic anhydrase/acetyltransferase-like protein (isoleucine patch superfamily)
MIRSLGDKTPRIAASAFISEAAYIIGDVEIGEDSGVFPGAVIRGDFAGIKIGRSTMVEDNTVIHTGEPLEIGDRNTIGHNVVIHCRKIGSFCLIGNNATILDEAVIGNFCIIAAGSLVSPGAIIPDYSLVVGLPGVIKPLTPAQKERLENNGEAYARMLERYRKQPELGSRPLPGEDLSQAPCGRKPLSDRKPKKGLL